MLRAPTATSRESKESVAPSLVVTLRRDGIDLLERAAHELGAEVADDLGERVMGGVAEAEGLGDRQRSVDEVRVGGEQRHADAVARKLTESDQRLEGGDAAAGDHDARRR